MSYTSVQRARPRVGVGVIVVNDEGKILILRRIGTHAPYYSIPGGSLEMGETFEQGAIRELKEECNIDLIDPMVIAVGNNLATYADEGLHFISVILLAKHFSGEPTLQESTKHSELHWANPSALPQPHFEASRLAVDCYLGGKFYCQ